MKYRKVASTVALGWLGGIAGFLVALAAICLVVAVAEPGLQSRLSIGARNLAWLMIGLAGLSMTSWLSFRNGLRHGVGWLLLASLSLLACGYTYVALDASQRDSRWGRLESLAENLRAQQGRSQLILPEDRSLVVCRVRTSEGDRMRVAPAGFWLKSLFGLDPLQLDVVVVELSPEGAVEAVRVDYF